MLADTAIKSRADHDRSVAKPAAKPTAEPDVGQSIGGQPVDGQPVDGQSIGGQPVDGQPVDGQPDAEHPVIAKDGLSPNRMQRAQGRVEVIFKPGSESQGSSDQAVALDTLYQSGSAKCLLPRVAGSIPEAVLLNTAGGITGGDRFDIRVGVSGGSAIATSQTAERIYRSAGGVGRVSNTLEIGAGAQLDWLPQETILFEGGQLARQLSVDMAPDATLWALESFVLGRAAMGEDVQTGFVSDQWRIRRGGALIYADGLRLGRKAFASNAPLDQHVGSIAATIAHPAAMAGHRAFANLIHVAPNAADQLGTARTLIAEWLHEHGRDIRMAASTWNGILGLRLLASSGHALRAALGFLLPRLRGAPLPRVWRL